MINKKLSIVIYIIAIILLSMYSTLGYQSFNMVELRYMLLMAGCGFILFFSTSGYTYLISKSLSPVVLFLLGFFIVYFQFPIDLLLGNYSENDSIYVNQNLIIPSLVISLLGLFSFLVGYMSFKKKVNCNLNSRRQVLFTYNSLKGLKGLFIVVAFAYLVVLIQNTLSGMIITQELLEERAGGLSNRMSILFNALYFAYLSLVLYLAETNKECKINIKKYINIFGFIPFLLLCGIIAFKIASGRRTSTLLLIIPFIWGMFYLRKKQIHVLYLLVILIIAASFATLIGLTRNMGNTLSIKERLEIVEQNDIFSESFLPVTAELAGSGQTLNYAIMYVPQKHEYLYGSFHLRNILSAIPFSNYISRSFLSPQKKYTSSAFFMTYLIQGEFYQYGNGTSILTDIYLNYGIVGVIVCMFFFGLIMSKITARMDSKPTCFSLVLFLYFISYAFTWPRYGLLDPINYISFSLIIIYVYVSFITTRSKSISSHRSL